MRCDPDRTRPPAGGVWSMEALEPRVLLSADPVLGAVQAVLLPDLDDGGLAAAYVPPAVHADAPADVPQGDAPIDADAAILAAGHSTATLVIGTPGGSQAIVLDQGGATVVASGDLQLWSDGPGGEVHLASGLIAPSVTIQGSGHTTTLSADVTAVVGNFTTNDSLRVSGARSITATLGSIVLGANSTHFLGGDSVATLDTLSLTAPLGNITFNGPIGGGQEGTDPLSGLTITAAQNVSFNQALVIDGDLVIHATGIVTFRDQITLRNGGDLIIQGASQVFMQGAVVLQTGNAAIGGNLVIEANEIDLAMSEELIQGSGNVTLSAATLATPIALLSPAGAATAGVLNLETTELRAFADGFASFTIGRAGIDGHAVAGAGAVTMGADTRLDGLAFFDSTTVYGGSITVVDYSDRNAILRLGAGDSLRLEAVNNITLGNEVEVDQLTLVSTAGRVAQADFNADNRVGEALRTPELVVQAVTGVALPSVEVQTIDVVNSGQGDVQVGVGAARTTTRFAAGVLDGSVEILRIAQTAPVGGNDVSVITQAGGILLSAGPGISVAGAGTVTLQAQGAGSDVRLDAPIAVVGGAVSITAADALTTGAAGSITASGPADISLTAGAGGLTLGAPVSTQGGTLELDSGGVLDLSGVTLSGGVGGSVTLHAVGTLTVGIVDAAVVITLGSDTGAIVDGLAGDAANLRGDAAVLTLDAATGIGTATNPLRMQVGTLEADNHVSGGIFVAEATDLTVAAGGLSTAGTGAGQGAIVLQLAGGALNVLGDVKAQATGTGSGHILLQSSGLMAVAADVVSASGSISLLAGQGLTLQGPAATQVRAQAIGQTLDLRSGSGLAMGAQAKLRTADGAIRVEAGGNAVLGELDAGRGTASVQAAGAITVDPGSVAAHDITAASVRLQSQGDIGGGADPVTLDADVLAVRADGGRAFFSNDGSLTVGSVAGAPALRVAANGTAAALAPDATLAGLVASGGVVLQVTGGDLSVAAGSGGVHADTGGNVLLQAQGAVALADVVSAGAGQVSVLAGGAFSATAAADIGAGGAGGIDLQAGRGLTMADGTRVGTAGGDISVQAGGDLTLGQLDAGAGNLAVYGAIVRGVHSGAGPDLAGGTLRLGADAAGTGADPLTMQVQRLAARSAVGGLFLSEADDLQLVDLPLASGLRVQADGSVASTPGALAALTGLASQAALVLQAGGSLAQDAAATVQAATALRLSAGGVLTLAAAVSSAGGPISLLAGGTLDASAAITAAGAGQGVDLQAGGDLLLAGAARVATQDGAHRLQAGGDLLLTELAAGRGSVALKAGGAVVDGDAAVDVQAVALLVEAGGAIGQGADALDTAVDTLAASASAGGLFIAQDANLVVGNVSVATPRVAADGSVANQAADTLAGLASGAAGALVLTVRAGDLQVDADVTAAGGATRLEAVAGSMVVAGDVATQGGALTLQAGALITQRASSQLRAGGGSVDVQAGAAIAMGDGARIESGGGAARIAAGGVLTLGRIDAGSGTLSIQAGAVRDLATDTDAGADLAAAALRLVTTGTTTGDGAGTSVDALDLAVGRMAADVRGGGLFLAQTGSLVLDTLGDLAATRVQADGTLQVAAVVDASLAGLRSAGALVLQAAGSVQGDATGTVNAVGNTLLAATGATADLQLAGNVLTTAGHLSIRAGRGLQLGGSVATDTAARTLDLEAGADLLLQQGSTLITRNGAMRLVAGGTITLESLNAGTGAVAVVATGGAIVDGDAAGDAEGDITAGNLLATAGAGGFGSGANAIETSVGTASVAATTGIFLAESSGLRIDNVSVTAQRVAGDATASALAAQAQEDLRVSGSGAAVVTLLAGDLTLAGGTATPAVALQVADGPVRLDAAAGKVAIDGGVVAAGGPVTVLARTDVTLGALGDITLAGAGTLDVQAGGLMTMADGAVVTSGGGNLRLNVTGTLTLGALQTAGDVSLLARSITDSGGNEVDVAARSLRVVASGTGAGQGFGTGAAPIQTQVALLAATVSGSGAGGFFAREADGLVVDNLAAIAVDRVAADGTVAAGTQIDGALSDLNSLGNLVLVNETGAIELRQGNPDDRAVQGVGNVLVAALGGNLQVDGAVRTTSGHVSLEASGDLLLDADVAIARTGRTVDLLAGGALRMAAGVAVTTVNSDIRLQAGGELAVAHVTAGSAAVSLISTAGSVVDADRDTATNVSATSLRVNAAVGIGTQADRLETLVGTVTARAAGGGIWLEEGTAVRVGDATTTVRRVGGTATVTDVVDALQSDLVTTGGNGSIALRTLAGDIDLTDGGAPADGRSVTADGSGTISLSAGGAGSVLDATTDDIRQQGPIVIDSAVRIQGTLALTAGLGTGTGDGAITLQRAVDGNPGVPADLLELHADGAPVTLQGAVGATQPLDGLQIDGATNVTFEQTVHLAGDLVIQASGVVEFKNLLTLDSGASLRVVGASKVVMGGVVLGDGDVVIEAGALQINGVVQAAGGQLSLQPAQAGGALSLGATGDGLVLDAATLAALRGFAQVDIGGAGTGTLAVDAATLASLASPQVQLAGGEITVAGRGTLAAGSDLVATSRGAITMAADAGLTLAGADATLQAQGDIAVGRIEGAVVTLASTSGTIRDAANDQAANVVAQRLVMRGQGPELVAGAATTPAALDVSAPVLDVDAPAGVVLRDSAPDGHTRINLLVGDILYQQLEATGTVQRVASSDTTAGVAPARTLASHEMAALLGAIRPLDELRETTQSSIWRGTPSEAGPAPASAALSYLADASSAEQLERAWVLGRMLSQPLATGWANSPVATVEIWQDSLAL